MQGTAAASFQGALWHCTFLCLKKYMFLMFSLRNVTRHDKKIENFKEIQADTDIRIKYPLFLSVWAFEV
jgi:hypothetical protein